MTAWVAVCIVGLGSYAFRWLPLSLVHRSRLTSSAQETLHVASLAALTAVVAGALRAPALTGTAPDAAATAAGVAMAALLIRRCRGVGAVVVAGLAARWLVLVVLS